MAKKQWHYGELTGRAAWAAWREQKNDVTCNCGSNAIEGNHQSKCVFGTAGGNDAIWLGCAYCSGSAVGYPIVYR